MNFEDHVKALYAERPDEAEYGYDFKPGSMTERKYYLPDEGQTITGIVIGEDAESNVTLVHVIKCVDDEGNEVPDDFEYFVMDRMHWVDVTDHPYE